MSIQCVAWVLEESEATGIDRLVLISLTNHAGKSEWIAWPSLTTLARESRVDRRTVIRAIKRLESDQHIEVERKPNRNNAYRVLVAESHHEVVTDLVTPESPASDTAVTRTVINRLTTPPTPQKGERHSLRSKGENPRAIEHERADLERRMAMASNHGRNLALGEADEDEIDRNLRAAYSNEPALLNAAFLAADQVIGARNADFSKVDVL